MNYTKTLRLNQITDQTLIVGIDVSKDFHVARAQDFRGIEHGKSITFNNDHIGIYSFKVWIKELMNKHEKLNLIVGLEPTGPYWINLSRELKAAGIKVVAVNPMHVKKSKELDDNSQTKTDYKDAKIIAQLVKDARYSEPNLLTGVYEELRNAKKIREILNSDLIACKNQIHNWLSRFFPEYQKVFKSWESDSFISILRDYVFPCVISEVKAEIIYEALPKKLRRGAGKNKISKLVNIAKNSIGTTAGHMFAAFEIRHLLNKYELFKHELEDLSAQIEKLCTTLPEVQRLLEIKGIGLNLASGIISELGDIRNYAHSDQLIKMAGLSLIECSSGKKKGQTTISKRGRSDLRKFLYQAIFTMISSNKGFKQLHKYYTERPKNQLKGRQSMMALARKFLRIIYAGVTRNMPYDETRMLSDIKRSETFLRIA
jgi:transposase